MTNFKQYPPYQLPKVSFTDVRLFNSISLRGARWQVALGNGKADISLQHTTDPIPAACSVSVTVNKAPWDVNFSSDEFFTMHPIVQAEGVDPGSIPNELKAALIESLLEPLLESLQKLLGAQIVVTDVQLGATKNVQPTGETMASALFSVDLSGADGASRGSLLVQLLSRNPQGTEEIFTFLGRLPRATSGLLSNAIADIPISFSVCAGQVCLLPEEFKSLNLGDVILVENWKPQQNQAELSFYCGNHTIMSAPCSLENGKAVLQEAPHFLTDSPMETTKATDIVLSFDLEKRTIPAKDLESLTAGYTFALSSQTRSPVTIRANGKPIALGRLVDINGKLGVELVEAL